eukprot:TRINITY_DN6277_c0_g1_i1.p1 TRINITY_DN6277_c0_g1~~TRINITY_DN6277_c0_g1_i1.p1  ORF type:complete len:68 (-),score=6.00 TRINITY_DN6277_c0_g1_i1:170-373(-)
MLMIELKSGDKSKKAVGRDLAQISAWSLFRSIAYYAAMNQNESSEGGFFTERVATFIMSWIKEWYRL